MKNEMKCVIHVSSAQQYQVHTVRNSDDSAAVQYCTGTSTRYVVYVRASCYCMYLFVPGTYLWYYYCAGTVQGYPGTVCTIVRLSYEELQYCTCIDE